MLDRIYLDNNETSSYPLLTPSSVYPQGLISEVSIMVDDDVYDVCIYSVVSSTAYVSAVFTGYRDGSRVVIGHSTWDRSGMAISNIISSENNENIGWISYGTIASRPGSYMEESKICPGCVRHKGMYNYFFTINGRNYNPPEIVNILVSGDFGYNGKINVAIDNFPEALDSDNPDINGSLNSVNGHVVTEEDTIVIQLPMGKYSEDDSNSAEGEDDDMTRVKLFGATGSGNIITISSDDSSNIDNYDELIAPFTCPNSDILLSSIASDKYDVSYHETPLDAFIAWYKENVDKDVTNEDDM